MVTAGIDWCITLYMYLLRGNRGKEKVFSYKSSQTGHSNACSENVNEIDPKISFNCSKEVSYFPGSFTAKQIFVSRATEARSQSQNVFRYNKHGGGLGRFLLDAFLHRLKHSRYALNRDTESQLNSILTWIWGTFYFLVVNLYDKPIFSFLNVQT